MRFVKDHWLEILIYVGTLIPLVLLASDYFGDRLSANPFREIELRTGRYTLALLIVTLACTPVYNVFGLRIALALRRMFGFITAIYAIVHFLSFVGIDYRFDFSLIWVDSSSKRYIWVGFAALIILLVLTVTSFPVLRRELGNRWKRVQQLIYIAAIFGALHFIWSAKADLRLPLIYTGIILLLLILRLPPLAQRIRIQWKSRKLKNLGNN